jgi:hypothetical protein
MSGMETRMTRCAQVPHCLHMAAVAALIAVLSVCTLSPAMAFTVFDTLATSVNGHSDVHDNYWNAQGFDLGSIPPSTLLSNVILSMLDSTGVGDFTVYIYDDNAGEPGSPLATLAGDTSPNAAGLYTYTPTSPLPLSADTDYYVVATVIGGTDTYKWTITGQSPSVGSGETGSSTGGDWLMSPYWLRRMQVNAEISQAIPEPGSAGLMLAGLGALGVWVRRRRQAI